jgi:hypothetical protein
MIHAQPNLDPETLCVHSHTPKDLGSFTDLRTSLLINTTSANTWIIVNDLSNISARRLCLLPFRRHVDSNQPRLTRARIRFFELRIEKTL